VVTIWIVLGPLGVLHVFTVLAARRRDRAAVYAHTCRALCVLTLAFLAVSGAAPEQIPQLVHDLLGSGAGTGRFHQR
jgi:hypothetical protein